MMYGVGSTELDWTGPDWEIVELKVCCGLAVWCHQAYAMQCGLYLHQDLFKRSPSSPVSSLITKPHHPVQFRVCLCVTSSLRTTTQVSFSILQRHLIHIFQSMLQLPNPRAYPPLHLLAHCIFPAPRNNSLIIGRFQLIKRRVRRLPVFGAVGGLFLRFFGRDLEFVAGGVVQVG